MTLKFEHKKWFVFIISILLITNLSILLDISFLRQIFGFLFLTILPGLLILQILKLNKTDFLEKFVLTVGLSISFLMFYGLLINNLSLSFGYKTPLATIPLLLSFNAAFIILAAIVYKVGKESSFSLPDLNLSTPEKAFLIVPILFPALSIFGMHLMNTADNNVILMFLLFSIPAYVIFVCFFNQKFPKRLYPVVIFLISISLLLLYSLRSNHIIGTDTHVEYSFFQITLNNLHWSVLGHSTLDACLAISLLPTIYQSILNMNAEFVFRILYSLLYSISPLVIYIISKKYVGESYGFLAACFFMFQGTFLRTACNARTNIAILFFALAMMVLFSDRIDPLKKRVLFIVFMASCMVSHYSTTYIFFFILLGAFMGMEVLSKKYTFKKVISLTIVLLFFSMIFFWYSQVTETSFNAGVNYVENTLINLNRFFEEESREEVPELFGRGLEQEPISNKIEFAFTWLTFTFIAIGVITLIRRYKEMSFPELKFKKPDFLKDKFKVEYLVIALVCSGLLVVTVALPYVSQHYGLSRLYSVAITILSVFFVIGGISLSKHFFFFIKHFLSKERTCAKKESNSFGKAFLSKKRFVLKEKQKSSTKNTSEVRAYLIILLVLVPFFLSVTSVTDQMLGDPHQIILNSEGEMYDIFFVHDQESCSAKWLKEYNKDKTRIYCTDDYVGRLRLMSQGNIPQNLIDATSFQKDRKIKAGYIYLGYYNVVDGKLFVGSNPGNLSNYSYQFVGKSKIYANGGSEIYK